MNKYVVVFVAAKLVGYENNIRYTLSFLEATSLNEAKGIAYECMHKVYPKNKGWTAHDMTVCDIKNANWSLTPENCVEVIV